MSQLVEVVERIAHYAESARTVNSSHSPEDRSWGLDLPPSRSLEPPYRRTRLEISQATANYPFHLPAELIELYQLGDGCLPARSPSTHSLNSPKDYFIFPNPELAQLLTLKESADFYKHDVSSTPYKGVYQRMFPIVIGLERRFWGILGSEKESIHSPIYFYRSDDPAYPDFAWPSLTALLSSWIEIKEKQLSSSNDKQIEQIVRKYGGTHEGQYVGMELLYCLSFDF